MAALAELGLGCAYVILTGAYLVATTGLVPMHHRHSRHALSHGPPGNLTRSRPSGGQQAGAGWAMFRDTIKKLVDRLDGGVGGVVYGV